jgi:dethiobiotin synthetase
MVPIETDYFMVDLIRDLKAKTILVAPTNLGSINDTLLSIEKLEREKLDFLWTLNLWRDRESFSRVTLPFYRERFGRVPLFEDEKDEIREYLCR